MASYEEIVELPTRSCEVVQMDLGLMLKNP